MRCSNKNNAARWEKQGIMGSSHDWRTTMGCRGAWTRGEGGRKRKHKDRQTKRERERVRERERERGRERENEVDIRRYSAFPLNVVHNLFLFLSI